MDAGTHIEKLWQSDCQNGQRTITILNETRFCLPGKVFFRCLFIWAGLFLSPSVYAICDDCTVPPIVGDYSYWYSRCDHEHGPYGSDFDAEFAGMWNYYSACNDPLVINQSSWPTETNKAGGDCGGPARYPRLKLGVEDKSRRGSIIQYCSTLTDGLGIWRTRPVECPSGTVQVYQSCQTDYSKENRNKNYGACTREGQDVADPINVSIGNSYQRETDLSATPLTGLEFVRFYNSLKTDVGDFGAGWMSTFERAVTYVQLSGTNKEMAYLRRPDGKIYYFFPVDGRWVPDEDVPGELLQTATGWQYTNSRDEVEVYDLAGLLLSITNRAGTGMQIRHNAYEKVESVITGLGETLTFSYTAGGFIESMTGPAGRVWIYQYDDSNNLISVVYPDATPGDDADNPARQYLYENPDFPNAMTGIIDERGIRYATFGHDSKGRTTTGFNGEGADRVDIVYNSNGSRVVTNSKGISSTYTTDLQIGMPLVTGISGPGCSTCGSGNSGYVYDPLTNDLLSKTSSGITTEYGDYDVNGNYGFRIDAKGTAEERRIEYTYDNRYQRKITTITESSVYSGSNKRTVHAYDDFGNRISSSIQGFDPFGNAVSRTTLRNYDGPLHQLSRIDGPRTDVSDITTLRYYPDDETAGNNRARLKEVEDASGVLQRSNIKYTATGKTDSEDRSNGLHLAYTYYPGSDRLELLRQSGPSGSQATRWTYLETGEVESITTGEGSQDTTTLSFDYDEARRLTRITDGMANAIEYTLDTEGNRVGENVFDSAGVLRKSMMQTFDSYNREDVHSQANELDDYDYAPDGTLGKQTDGEGIVTTFSYDALKRMLSSTRDLGGLDAMVRYGYDGTDNLVSVIDPVNGDTAYQYDDLGNLLKVTSPDTGATEYSYDAAGNVISKQDSKGRIFNYKYDVLNRLTSVDVAGTEEDINYTYDSCSNGIGKLCDITMGNNMASYAYDVFGNVVSHQLLDYSYDASNRIKTIVYPSGSIVSFNYDLGGQVQAVDLTANGATIPLASNVTYYPFGVVNTLGHGNGTSLSQSLDTAYRLTSQRVAGVLDLSYPLYGKRGNLLTRTDTYSGTSSFTYDALERLDTGSGGFGSREYDYDLNGNRTGMLSEGNQVNYGYTPGTNRLLTETGWTYSVDSNGNTTDKLEADNTGAGRSFGYNSHNRLVSVTDHVLVTSGKRKRQTTSLQDVPVAAFAYNGLGQRVSKDVGGNVTRFLFATNGALMAELDSNDEVQREYVYLNGRLLAVLDQVDTSSSSSGEVTIDNGSPPAGWTSKTSNKDVGADYLYSPGGSGNKVRWTPELTAGSYDVYASYIHNRKYSSNVPTTITHDGQTDTVWLDQTSGGASWQLLGTYDFDGSGNEFIEVSDINGRTTADAMKFVSMDAPASSVSTRVSYVHDDHLGTPQAMTDDNGSVVWRAMYNPFGSAAVDDSGTRTLNVRYPGQYYDQETGLHYNYYRYYDPGTGRYMTSDPRGILLDYSGPERQIAAQMGVTIPADKQPGYINNSFNYVDSNPVMGSDPTGEVDPVTAGLIIWGLLYANHAGDWVSDPDGNLWGEPDRQDDICTLGPILGPIGNACFPDRCKRHDDCYTKNHCTASSWGSNALGGTKPCNQCNGGFFK